MTTKKKLKPLMSLAEKTNLALSPSKNILATTSVQPISIYFGGDSHIGEIIEVILKDAFPKCSITVEFGCDSGLWSIEDTEHSFNKTQHDLCILLMNNMLFLPPTNFKARMEAGCAFIKDLTVRKRTTVIALYSMIDNFQPDTFIAAGAKIVYRLPLPLRTFTKDFPVIMGWETRKDFKRIVV